MGYVLYQISTWALPAVLAITLHEAAHGHVAALLGDDTAKRLGRVSLNPLRHIDPFGTVLLPGLLIFAGAPAFGYAKPVPVDYSRLASPRRDMMWVALAGPATNLALAIAAALGFHLVADGQGWFAANLVNALSVNLVLAVFNMLPLPPLDGGRVAVGLLPDVLAFPLARFERYGMPLLLIVLFLLPVAAGQAGIAIDPLGWLIWPPVDWLGRGILALAGHG
ncbi:MAG: site-2 protease family protein [Alphaproteobacteria bacterium]|nr:site-2 protease family protein [Alphaproteobacteria bacterium]